MSEILSKAKANWLAWKLTIFYVILFSAVSLGTAWQTAMAGANWTELDFDARVRVGVGVFTTWGTVMLAFINKTISRVEAGKLPGSDDEDKPQKPNV